MKIVQYGTENVSRIYQVGTWLHGPFIGSLKNVFKHWSHNNYPFLITDPLYNSLVPTY